MNTIYDWETAGNFNESLQPVEPFLIRGHHSESLYQALALGVDPAASEDATIDYIKDEDARPGMRQSYLTDVFGYNEEGVRRFRESGINFVEEFLALPDEHPVKVVVDQKDKLCDSCAIGDHCSLKSGLLRSKIDGDEGYLMAFKKVADRLGLEDQYDIVDSVATYSNGKPRTVPNLVTTAAVARKVFSQLGFPSSTQNSAVPKSVLSRLDRATPEQFMLNNPGFRNKVRPLRPFVSILLAYTAMSGIFHAGQTAELYSQWGDTHSGIKKARIENKMDEKISEIGEELLISASSLLFLSMIPRRRIRKPRPLFADPEQ